MMTPKQRMLTAMEGKPVDRVPVAFHQHFTDQTDNTVRETVEWTRASRSDMCLVATDGFYALMSDTPLFFIEDWLKFRPYKKDHPYITIQCDRTKRIVDELGDDAAVFQCTFTPLSHFKHTLDMGETIINEYWNTTREELLQVLDVIEETTFIFLDELAKTGLDGMMVSLQQAEKWRFPKDVYNEFIRPADERLLAYTKARFPHIIDHLCSWETDDTNSCINLDLFKDYEFECVNWGVYQRESMSMAEGKKFFNTKSVMGGFDRNSTGVLWRGNEQQIKEFTTNLIRETGKDAFIISSDCSIIAGTPVENLRWVVEASEAFEG